MSRVPPAMALHHEPQATYLPAVGTPRASYQREMAWRRPRGFRFLSPQRILIVGRQQRYSVMSVFLLISMTLEPPRPEGIRPARRQSPAGGRPERHTSFQQQATRFPQNDSPI